MYKGRRFSSKYWPNKWKPFTSIMSNQPTILIISNFLKESVFRKFTASHASHGWEAVNNHMWKDKSAQAG